MLGWRLIGLRLRHGVDALGNAIGESIASPGKPADIPVSTNADNRTLLNAAERAADPDRYTSWKGQFPDLSQFYGQPWSGDNSVPAVDRPQGVLVAGAGNAGVGDALRLDRDFKGWSNDQLEALIQSRLRDLDRSRAGRLAEASKAEAAITDRLNRDSVIRETVASTISSGLTINWSVPPLEPLSMSMQAAQVAVDSTISAITEVPAMAVDLVHVGVGTLYTAVTGQPDYVPMLSSLGKAGMGDASTTDLLHSLNPVYGLMVGSYEARQGLERGDSRPLAAFSGSLLGGGIAAYATPSLPGYRPGVFSPATVNAANRVAGSAKSAIYSLLPDVPDITVNPFPPELSRGATVLPKLPYSDSTRRPAYGPTQVPDVWKAAQDAQGRVFDPNKPDIELFWDTTKPRNGQWDMGHTQGNDYQSLYKDYMNRKMTPEEFLREYRDPENYRPESPSENRGRRHDRPRN